MKKRIWIVNYYTNLPDKVSNPRHIEIANYLYSQGYDVTVYFAEYQNTISETFISEVIDGVKYVKVKSPFYVGNGFARMKSIWCFAWTLLRNRVQLGTPDVILHNIHPPFDLPIVWLSKRVKSRYIAEAWDLWPDDFVAFGLISKNNPLMKIAYQIEKYYYYSADSIIFTFLGAKDYIINKGWTIERGGNIDIRKFHYINNGVNLNKFEKNKKEFARNDPDINDENLKKIVYVGSIRRANNIKELIQAAEILINIPNYKFFIYGDGNYRTELEEYVLEHNINNVIFKEKHIPFEEVAWVVSQASVNIMNYERGFGRYGLSSGKLFQYLAAGKPIVCNIPIPYDDVISYNNLGIANHMTDAEDYARSIKSILDLPKDEYDSMCERVKITASMFDYKVLAEQEYKVIDSLFK